MKYKFPIQYTDEQILLLFSKSHDPMNALTISDVSDKLNCHNATAKMRLDRLVEMEKIKSTKIYGRWIYWKE